MPIDDGRPRISPQLTGMLAAARTVGAFEPRAAMDMNCFWEVGGKQGRPRLDGLLAPPEEPTSGYFGFPELDCRGPWAAELLCVLVWAMHAQTVAAVYNRDECRAVANAVRGLLVPGSVVPDRQGFREMSIMDLRRFISDAWRGGRARVFMYE